MHAFMPSAILAVGVEDILPIVFVLIGIVSWIINALKEKSQVNERPARPVRRAQNQRDESLQNEIDIFIQEVTDKRGGAESQQSSQTRSRPAPERPAPVARERRSRTLVPVPPPAPAPKKKAKHTRPGEEISSRKGPGSRDLGIGLSRHFEERMKSHSIRDETERRLGHDVDASVVAHLGVSSTAVPVPSTVPAGSQIISEVRRMLASPQTAAQAIVLNEILSPPRSRRS